MKNWIKLAGIVLAATAVACSPGAADAAGKKTPSAPASTPAPAIHPVSGLPVVPLTVTTASGAHLFRVEVATSPAAQEQGLMYRTAMGADEGMIFPMAPPRRTAFWMRNTVIGLDIIFIGTDGRVLNVAANARPFDDTALPSDGPVSGVLELNAGMAARIGLEPGDKVAW